MHTVLDYASPTTPQEHDWRVAAIPSAIAVVSALVLFVWSTQLAAAAQIALIVPTDCGTGRHDAERTLYYCVPYCLTVPIAGWFGAHRTQMGVIFSRCAVWTSILAWGVSTLFVAYR
ncbi:MAG: hypothetical protein QM770_16870 [Tepidisphaeraceae bacterium]